MSPFQCRREACRSRAEAVPLPSTCRARPDVLGQAEQEPSPLLFGCAAEFCVALPKRRCSSLLQGAAEMPSNPNRDRAQKYAAHPCSFDGLTGLAARRRVDSLSEMRTASEQTAATLLELLPRLLSFLHQGLRAHPLTLQQL